MIDLILIHDVFFLVLIQVSSKVSNFHNQENTLSRKLDTNFLTLSIVILYKSAL